MGLRIKDPRYKTGTSIPFDGHYQIFHSTHRLPREIVLVAGDLFPRCAKCDKPVMFVFVREIKRDFAYERMRLYEIPVLEDEDEKADSAAV